MAWLFGIGRYLRRAARKASWCLLAYWLLIFTATHLPSANIPQVTVSDKLAHGLAYFGLGFLLAWALPTRGTSLSHLPLAAAIAVGYACIDELTQNFIPGRVCDVWDLAADGVGIAAGLTAYLVLRQFLLSMHWGRKLILGLSS